MALKIESAQSLDKKDLMKTIWGSVYQLFGEFGASQTGMFTIQYDENEKTAIVRCSHKALDIVRAAIAAVTKINETETAIRVVAVSGTLKALRKKL